MIAEYLLAHRTRTDFPCVTQDFEANILYEILEIEFQFPLFFVFIITFMVNIFCK